MLVGFQALVCSASHVHVLQVLVANKAGIGKIHKCKGRRQYVANVTLKINAKLGGVNVRLAGDVHVVSIMMMRLKCSHGDKMGLHVCSNGQ